MAFFTEIEKTILKFVWNHKRSQIAKAALKKNKAGGITLPKTILQSYSNQNSMVLAHEQTHKSINIIESSVINPHIYGKLFYNKGAKSIQWRKDSLFNKWCWEN